MATDEKPTVRILYIDVLRAAAIVMVILTHVCQPVLLGFRHVPPLTWGVFNVANTVFRACVPLFFMISGRLLLRPQREETAAEFFRRKVVPLLVPFVAWSFIYFYFMAWMNPPSNYSFRLAVERTLYGWTAYHLWFMYALIGIYLMIPVFRVVLGRAPRADVVYLLVVWAVFAVLQFLTEDFHSYGPASMFVGYGGYFILGSVLGEIVMGPRRRRALVAAMLAVISVNAVLCYRVVSRGGSADMTWGGYMSPGIVLYSSMLFLLARQIDFGAVYDRFPFLRRPAEVLSFECFNIYIVHLIFLELLWDGRLGFRLNERTGHTPFIGVPATAAAVLLASLALSSFLERLPGLSRVLVISRRERR